jgi:hypothetical protein
MLSENFIFAQIGSVRPPIYLKAQKIILIANDHCPDDGDRDGPWNVGF